MHTTDIDYSANTIKLPKGYPTLYYYKIDETVKDPVVKTAGSACFDIPISLRDGFSLKTFQPNFNSVVFEDIIQLTSGNSSERRMSMHQRQNINEGLLIKPNVTYLIPTGLIFIIPDGYHIQIHLRSSTGLKKHLGIPSHIGIIDSDYRDEVHVPLHSISNANVLVNDGDMLAQAMLVKNQQVDFERVPLRPERLDSRQGGFGSTGN